MKNRHALALLVAASLGASLASAAPRISAPSSSAKASVTVPADPLCGGPKTPEGPQPPKEPPKT